MKHETLSQIVTPYIDLRVKLYWTTFLGTFTQINKNRFSWENKFPKFWLLVKRNIPAWFLWQKIRAPADNPDEIDGGGKSGRSTISQSKKCFPGWRLIYLQMTRPFLATPTHTLEKLANSYCCFLALIEEEYDKWASLLVSLLILLQAPKAGKCAALTGTRGCDAADT